MTRELFLIDDALNSHMESLTPKAHLRLTLGRFLSHLRGELHELEDVKYVGLFEAFVRTVMPQAEQFIEDLTDVSLIKESHWDRVVLLNLIVDFVDDKWEEYKHTHV